MPFIERSLYNVIRMTTKDVPAPLLDIMVLLGKEEESVELLEVKRLRFGMGAVIHALGVEGLDHIYRRHTYLFKRFLSDVGYLIIKNSNGPHEPKDWSVHLEGSVLATFLLHELKEWEVDGRNITRQTMTRLLTPFNVSDESRHRAAYCIYHYLMVNSDIQGNIHISPRPFEVRGVDVPGELKASRRL
jgi:hypothetical protein